MRGANTPEQVAKTATVVPLDIAIAERLRDGDVVSLEECTHLSPFAMSHETILQGRRYLPLATRAAR